MTDDWLNAKDIKQVWICLSMLAQTMKNTYFYQCSGIESTSQVMEIGSFLRTRKKDPLLRFCIGIYLDSNMINNSESLTRVKEIFQVAQPYSHLVPILHYSFKFSKDPIGELTKLKKVAPYIRYIQLNDLNHNELEVLRFACKHWRVDFPLNDRNFNLIHNQEFVDTIVSQKVITLLDNSRGRGIRENRDRYLQKINILLNKGINRIALCGGFNADNLQTYFEVSNDYPISFSIDAESKLKTDGRTDICKVKKYFTRLIERENVAPKYKYLEGTANLLKKEEKITKPHYTSIGKNKLVVFPRVFNPDIFFSSKWFARRIPEIVKGEQDFLEIGCGTGIVSIMTALSDLRQSIVASDISKDAVKNVEENVRLHHLQKRVAVFQGDVFDGLPLRRKFDTIFWALPFGYAEPGTLLSPYEAQVHDAGYTYIQKFFAEAAQFLKPSGRLLVGFSSDIGHLKLLRKIAQESGFALKRKEKCKGMEKDQVSMEIWEARLK